MENDPDLPKAKVMEKKVDTEKSTTIEEVIEEKASNFDAVVKCMTENAVEEYLHDILSFLLSDRSQLHFEASGYGELFLVNLLNNEDNLNCKFYNKRCASISKQIIKVLDKNKDVYKCIHFCENEGNRKFLVYKKELTANSQTTCCDGDSCCSSFNPQSITENLHSDCPNHHSHKVSQAFKSRWLNTTLKFIKDESKHNLKYPEMSPMEATFVYSLITRCKEQTDVSANSYYTPLKEAMQIFGLKYFFELTYIDTYPNGKMSLMLEKIPKNIKSIIEGDKRCSNRFRNMKFIKQVRTRTSDENRAGRVVSRLKNQERLKTDANRLGDPADTEIESQLTEDSSITPNEHSSSMDNIARSDIFAAKRSRKNKAGRGGKFGGAEVEGRVSHSRTRDPRRERSTDSRTDKLLKDMSVPIKSDKAMKMMYGMGWDGGALGARGEGITEPIIPTLDINAGAGLGHNVHNRSSKTKQKKSKEVKAPRSHSTENRTPRSHSTDNRTPRPHSTDNKTPPPKYVELKPPCPPIYTRVHSQRVHFRAVFYQTLLDMITSCDTVRYIRREKMITNREKNFIIHVIRAANERTNNGISDPTELKLWSSIFDQMTSNPDLHIKATVSQNSKMLTLTKEDSPYMSKKKKRKLQIKPSILNIPALQEGSKKLITNDFIRQVTDTYVITYVGFPRIFTKAPAGLTFRVVILIHLLETINSDRMKTEVEFEKALNDKEREYVENTVATLGTRKKRGGSRLEQELLTEMKDNLEGYLLRVEFLNDRTFNVHKVEMKCVDKSSRDISYTTCSTDDTDKNNLYSRCSDDSDAGHDDLLDNDNDGDDEHNDSNDASEASKDPDINRNELQDRVPTELCSIEEKKKINEFNDQIIDDIKPEDTEFHVLEMDVQNSVKDTTSNILKTDSLDSNKDTKCVNVLISNVSDFEKREVIVPEIDTQNLNIDTKIICENNLKSVEKNTNICAETKIKVLKEKTEINLQDMDKNCESGCEIDVHDVEKQIEMNISKTDSNSLVVDVLKSHVQNSDKNPEMCVLETDIKYTLKEGSNLLESVNDNLGKKNDSIAIVSTDNNLKSYLKGEKLSVNIKESNKDKEIIKTNNPHCSISTERRESENSKINKYTKRVYLVPCEYPIKEVDTHFAKNVQIMISKEIETSTELPLLKCHGVQDGALVYSCHSENTLQWLENMCVSNNIKIMIPVNDEVRYKMTLKINSFIDYTSAKLFQMLQLYNEGLQIESWIEYSVEKNSDSIIFIVEIDEKSMKCIKESNFTLFAGIDQVQFNPVWN